MPETAPIRVADLLIDPENPRLSQPNIGQRDAIRALAGVQGTKLEKLAKDIVKYGLNPSELPLVMPHKGDLSRYIVLEGNRRLTALKSLENPESLVGAIRPKTLAQIREHSKRFLDNPIERILCYVVRDREEAHHWLEIRHGHGHAGAGIEKWGSDEAARFQARTRTSEPHTLALDFLQDRGRSNHRSAAHA